MKLNNKHPKETNMNRSKRTVASFLILIMAFAGCKKADLAGFSSTGEGLVSFSLLSPASGTTVVLNAATPNAMVDFAWTASTPGLKTPPGYKWVAALKAKGSLDTPLIAFPSANKGFDTKLSITFQQLDSALKAKGISAGAQTNLVWSVLADNGSTKLLAQNVYNISITRFQDGASPFVILGPSPNTNTTPAVINPMSTTDSLKFNWTRSIPANSANPVKYKVWFYKNYSDSALVFSVSANNSGSDSLLYISFKQISDSLSAHGLADLTKISSLKWTVSATSGGWTQWSNYTNVFYLQREVKLYLVGGSSPAGWTPSAAIRMIPDGNFPGVFFIYAKLIASGGGIKFLAENTDWSTPTQKIYGDPNGSGISGILTQSGGGNNINVSADGIYRVVADLNQNKYWVQTGSIGALGLVGAFQGWNPPSAIKMAYTAPNQFIRLQKMSAGDEFKLHDGNAWDHSAPQISKWFDEVDAYPGLVFLDGVIANENNIKNTVTFDPADPADSLVRVIFDGTDVKNLKYRLTKGRIFVIGDATAGGWNNNTGMSATVRPPLTYQGNGVWKGTVTLSSGNIKFIVQQGDWSFSYGGAGGILSYQNGSNIVIAAPGTYSITVDEYQQTYSVQ